MSDTRWILWAREHSRRREQELAGDGVPGAVGPDGSGPGPDGAHVGSGGVRPGPAGDAARPRPPTGPAGHDAEMIDQIIDRREVEVEYETVHDTHGQVVGFEAVARGPRGPLRSPTRLFAAARVAGRVGELDWICRAAAFHGMLEADLPTSLSLFVNVEPDSLIEPCPEDLLSVVWQAESRLRVYIDITGQALARYPCQVLETVRRARAAKWGVAINEIESSAQGIALLPTLEPDVVKLNHNLLSVEAGHTGPAILAALAESERTGAALLIEHVQDRAGAELAAAVGAGYQQGPLYGPQGPLPARVPPPRAPLPLLHIDNGEDTRTPWDILAQAHARRISPVTPAGLVHLTKTMAAQAFTGQYPPLVISVIPTSTVVDAESVSLFGLMLERCPLVIILGSDVEDWNNWRVRAANLPATHPLSTQTCFLMLSPGSTMVMAARPNAASTPTAPSLDVAVTQDPATTRIVVRALLNAVDSLAGGVHHRG